MTEILFCDLCNESVPESDLLQGRAFRIKGRVVCTACDHAMRGAAAQSALAADASAAVASAPSGTPPAVGTAPNSSVTTTAAAPQAEARASGGGFTLALAAAALAVTVALGYWTTDQFRIASERASVQQSETLERAERTARADDSDIARRVQALSDSLDSKLTAIGAEQRSALEAGVGEGARRAAELSVRLTTLDTSITEMKVSLAALARHDAELSDVRTRLDAMRGELEALATKLDGAITALAAAATPHAAPAEEPKAAWSELLPRLESPESGKRYLAIIALWETADPAVAPFLVPCLKDEDIFNRIATARALEELANPVAVEAL